MHGIFIFDTCLRSIHRRSCGLRQAVHPILDRQRLAFSVNSHRIIHPCLHSNHRRSCSLRQAFNVHRWQLIPPHPSTFVAGLPGDKLASFLQLFGHLISSSLLASKPQAQLQPPSSLQRTQVAAYPPSPPQPSWPASQETKQRASCTLCTRV
jgi:hypothetical protein